MKYGRIITIALVALTTACQREDAGLQETGSGTPMSLYTRTGGVENPVFADGDKIGMFVTTTGEALKATDNCYTNACLTLGEGVWGGGVMYYPNTVNVDIYNYFPYQAVVSDVHTLSVNVVADQSVAGAYKKSDFLWAKAIDCAKTKEGLEVVLKHKMSKAEIRLFAGNGVPEDFLKRATTVKLLNMKIAATADLSTGEISVSGSAADMNMTAARAGEGAWMAIVVPQALVAGTNAIEITLEDGSKRVYKLDNDVSYQAGKVKRFDITVSNESLSVKVVSIEDWTDDGNIVTGEAKIEVSASQETGEGTAVGTAFAENAQLGMYFFSKGTLMDNGNNVLYTATADGSLGSATTLYYPAADAVDIYAYAPYSALAADPASYTFGVVANQAAQGAVVTSDLLLAKATGLKNGGTAAALTFEHAMSRVVVNLVKGNGITDAELAAAQVSICNTALSAIVNLKDGTMNHFSGEADVIPVRNGNSFEAILLPQTVSGEQFVKVSLLGAIWGYKPVALVLKQGSRHTINIKVSNTGISVSTPVISGWNEEPPINGEGVKLIPQGALLDWSGMGCQSSVWTKAVGMGGDILLLAEKNNKTYVYIRPKEYDGVILEFTEDGMPGRVITANNGELHELAVFFTVKPSEASENLLGMGLVTTDRQIAILKPETIPAAFKTGKLSAKIQEVVNKLADVLVSNGMENQLPPASLACNSALITMLGKIDLENLPSFAENGANMLEQCEVNTACDLVDATTFAAGLVVGNGGTNAFETAEDEYQIEIDLIKEGSLYGFGDVKVTLKWDCEGDIDLHMKDPAGYTIYYEQTKPSGCAGFLDKDNQVGYGPENIFYAEDTAPQGTYKVMVRRYDNSGSTGHFTLFIYAKGKAKTFTGSLITKSTYFSFDLNGHFAEIPSGSW